MTTETAIAIYDLPPAGREGVIRLDERGTLYTNQTGGVCCNHPEARGFFTPIPVPGGIRRIVYERLNVREDEAESIDRILARHGLPFRVDRAALWASEEAWLYVEYPSGGCGILVWQNSD